MKIKVTLVTELDSKREYWTDNNTLNDEELEAEIKKILRAEDPIEGIVLNCDKITIQDIEVKFNE